MVAPESKTFNKNLKEKFEDQIKRPGPASYKAIDHKSKNAPAVSFAKDYRRSELDKEFDMRPPIQPNYHVGKKNAGTTVILPEQVKRDT